MKTTSRAVTALVIGLQSLGWSAVSHADPSAEIASTTSPVPAFRPVAKAVSAERLANSRGRAGVINRVLTDGSVTGNTASHVTSGSNSIADGSFANSSGLSTVIQNSGANVLIQNATIVNVEFK